MTSPIVDESKGPAGMPVYGFDLSDSPKEAYNSFIDSLEKYDVDGNNKKSQLSFSHRKLAFFIRIRVHTKLLQIMLNLIS